MLSGGSDYMVCSTVVIFMTVGALAKSLLLFLDLLPLLPVDGISAADDIVGAGLDRKSAFF